MLDSPFGLINETLRNPETVVSFVYIEVAASFGFINGINAVIGIFHILSKANQILTAKPFEIELMTALQKDGFIAPAEMASGNLYFDDEDHNNKNWAQVWLGPQNQYEPHGTYYGVQLDRNTRYHVCLNTDKTNFTKLVRSAI